MSKQAERDYPLKVDQRHLFDKPYNDPRVLREFALALDLFLQHVPAGRILDVGCGPGWTSLLLAKAGYDVTGVDISERMIEIAQERSARENMPVDFLVGDMEKLDFGRGAFDGALFFDCLHHCPGYAEALRRTGTQLRAGGYIVLFETTWLHRYSRHARETTAAFGVTELGFTRRQLRQALTKAGFGDVTFFHDPGPAYRGFSGFCKASLRVLCDFVFCFPQAKNIVVARKQ
jgi:2-polyprenyl-3-methyl-5-hydroxy-6-metoxy-1,4-benzoquinol methylase